MGKGNPNPSPSTRLHGPGPGRPKGSKNRITRERWEQEIRALAFTNTAALSFHRLKHPNGRLRTTFTLREVHEMPEEAQRCIASIKVRTENLSAGDDKQDETVEIRWWDKIKALELGARFHGWLKDKVEITAPEELISRLDDCKARARAAKLARAAKTGDV